MKLDPNKTAILAVHMQNDVVTKEGAFAEFFSEGVEANNIISVVGSLLEAGRAAEALTIYTRVAWQPGFPDLVANSPLLGIVKQAGCLVDGSHGAAIVDSLKPHDEDFVVTHQRVSGFHASVLDLTLRSQGRDTVVIAGVATNASVESTARSASDLGYRTIVVSDACSAAHDAAHAASLESLGLLAEIATVEEITGALG